MPASRGAAVRAVLALLLAAGLAAFVKFCVFEEGGAVQSERAVGELPAGISESGDALSPEISLETLPVPATVMFSAGANGTIIARVGGGMIARGGAVEAGGNTVDIVFEAIPDAGYRVDSWTDLGDAACGGESGGHGGPRRCAARALGGGDYHVSVGFAAGALPADIPESGDVPARGVGGVLSCTAFGGEFVPAVVNDTCRDFAGAGSNCVIEGQADADCQAAFNAARDCNAGNQTAVAAGCGSACGVSRIAVGGACQDAGAGPFRVSFSPEANVQAFRIDGTPAVSGGQVSGNVVLSVVATPAAGSFVAGWSGDCEVPVGKHRRVHGGDEGTDSAPVIQTASPVGGFDDAGAKFCLARITMNTDVTADIQAKPPGAPDYPVFGSDFGAGEGAAAHQANCELFGGVYNGANPAIVRCAHLDENNAECLHVSPFGAATCGRQFDTMRTCLNVNRPVKFLKPDAASSTGLRAECKDACSSGERARGILCLAAGD